MVPSASNGIEFSIPLFSSGYVSLVRTEVQGCSASGCEGDDIRPCAAYRAP